VQRARARRPAHRSVLARCMTGRCFWQSSHELVRREIAEARVWTHLVVVAPPTLEDHLCLARERNHSRLSPCRCTSKSSSRRGARSASELILRNYWVPECHTSGTRWESHCTFQRGDPCRAPFGGNNLPTNVHGVRKRSPRTAKRELGATSSAPRPASLVAASFLGTKVPVISGNVGTRRRSQVSNDTETTWTRSPQGLR
jgi:hypothetical protein